MLYGRYMPPRTCIIGFGSKEPRAMGGIGIGIRDMLGMV
jgi:hypothetical protein